MEDLLGILAGLVTVFGWAFFSFWSAIPAGIALRLSPILVALTVTLSYGAGVAIVVIAGAPVRERIRRRMAERGTPLKIAKDNDASGIERDESRPFNRMLQVVQNGWNHYGLWGLSVLAPMTVGAQVGAVIGLSLGVPPLRLTVAMTIGAALWAVLITLAVTAGVLTVSQLSTITQAG